MYTQADLDAVRAAIARGESRVQYADRSITYRDVQELITLEAHIARSLSGGTQRSKQTTLVASKGL